MTNQNSYATLEKAIQRGLGRGFQAPEINSGDSPSAFPHERYYPA